MGNLAWSCSTSSTAWYRLDIDRTPHYVVAGNLAMAQDNSPYFHPSILLPEIEVNLRFDDPAT